MGFTDTLKSIVRAAYEWASAAIFKLTASDNKVSDIEHHRRKAEHLQNELSLVIDISDKRKVTIEENEEEMSRLHEAIKSMEGELDAQKGIAADYQVQLGKIRESMLEMVRRFLDVEPAIPYETIYNLTASALDNGGWYRLKAARRMIPENVYTYFYAEDSMGKFEAMNGNEMLYWLELTKYGDIDWNQEGCYERVSGHKLRLYDKSYIDYRIRLHKQVLEEMLADQNTERS